MVLEKTVESPLECKEIQPVHPKEISPEYSLEVLMLNLKLQYFDVKNWLIWKDPDAGKDWRWEEKGITGWDDWMASLTQWTWVWVNSGSWWWTGRPGMLQSMRSQRVGNNWASGLNWKSRRSPGMSVGYFCKTWWWIEPIINHWVSLARCQHLLSVSFQVTCSTYSPVIWVITGLAGNIQLSHVKEP